MSDDQKTPRPYVRIIGGSVTNVYRDVVSVPDSVNVHIEGLQSTDVGGSIVNVVSSAQPSANPLALNDAEEPTKVDGPSDDPWHKKPIGMIGLSLVSGLLLAAAIWAISHYLA